MVLCPIVGEMTIPVLNYSVVALGYVSGVCPHSVSPNIGVHTEHIIDNS